MSEDSEDPNDLPTRTPPRGPLHVTTATWNLPRRYAVYSGNVLFGTTNLEYPVVFGSRIAGRFYPTQRFAAIAHVFDLYQSAVRLDNPQVLIEYVRNRDKLYLELWDSGMRLESVIELIARWAEATYVIHVKTVDQRVWRWRPMS